jgi:cytoplasmic iron level regulating protein YaaA (DUF328/UPF0246 family)
MNATHATCNPPKDVISPVAKLTHKHTSNATEKKAANKCKDNKLQEYFQSFFENQQEQIEAIAEKHGKKPEYIHCVVTNAPQAKSQAMSLYNALLYHKWREMNDGMCYDSQVQPYIASLPIVLFSSLVLLIPFILSYHLVMLTHPPLFLDSMTQYLLWSVDI